MFWIIEELNLHLPAIDISVAGVSAPFILRYGGVVPQQPVLYIWKYIKVTETQETHATCTVVKFQNALQVASINNNSNKTMHVDK